MTTNNTYPAYQAAKIANPDKEIVTTATDWDANKDCIGTFEPLSVDHWLDNDAGWITCNPADYCMTVKQFLDAGHKFVDGDKYLYKGVVFTAKKGELLVGIGSDDEGYVLKSKYLEEAKLIPVKTVLDAIEKTRQPTKTHRYEKVDFEKTIEVIDDEICISSDLYFMWSESNAVPINQVTGRDLVLNRHKLCRRIEVTERELFIEEACRRCGWEVGSAAASMVGDMFDAGARFVNGKG